jgi:hypothetical protein
MIEKLKTKGGYVVVSEVYLDVDNRERPDLLQPDEAAGRVWLVVRDGMGVHRFGFADPEEAAQVSAMIQYAADKAKALLAGETELHGDPIGPPTPAAQGGN